MVILSRRQVSEIKKVLNLDDTQTALLEKKLCIDMSIIKDKVLYSYKIKKNCKRVDIKGIISKKEYEYLKREKERHPARVYYSKKIGGDILRIRFYDLKFSEDINIIDDFYVADDEDNDIFGGLNLDSDNDRYDPNDENISDSDDY